MSDPSKMVKTDHFENTLIKPVRPLFVIFSVMDIIKNNQFHIRLFVWFDMG